jgi:outer membrane protein OmpA-like peptidoglycan-associated protein
MRFRSLRFAASFTTALFFCSAAAAERETLSFGGDEPPAESITRFLFPEAQCEREKCEGGGWQTMGIKQVPAVRPKTERSIGMGVRFLLGSAELTDAARAQLRSIGRLLAERSPKLGSGEIVVEGHTDMYGTPEYNQKLSERRAQTVVQYLVNEYGVRPSALQPVGWGQNRLIDRSNPYNEANRRVEIVRRPE